MRALMALCLLVFLCIQGCNDETDHEKSKRVVENAEALKNPKVIGQLEDGRIIKRVESRQYNEVTHYIYFVDDVVTVNMPSGKTSNVVYVNLNGKSMSLNQAQVELGEQEAKYHEQELARLRANHK